MTGSFEHTEQQLRQVRQARWDFTGDVVLITGAAHGQGRSHALGFARAGADLALCDLDQRLDSVSYPLGTQDDLEQVADECRALGAEVLAQTCDVRDDDQVMHFVDEGVRELGKIDVAVANAGLAGIVEVVDMSEQVWDELVDTNLKGVFLTLRHCARKMIEAGDGGRLIATGSVHCFTGVPGSAHYVAAKHGVAGLCKSLAIELAPHQIRVNNICPTAVNTTMIEVVADPRVPETHGERLVATTGVWNMLEEGAPAP